MMSAAEIALWTRNRALTIDAIRAALWQRHDVVRTACMRLTLHLIPADDFSLYIAALEPVSSAILKRIFVRLKAPEADVKAMNDAIMNALAGGPRTQRELVAHLRATSTKRVRLWLDRAWSPIRPAVSEGKVCYGPPKGSDATFVLAESWLPPQRKWVPAEAASELASRFLAAFGPATPNDFSRWTGLKAADANAAFESLGDAVVHVAVDGERSWLLRRDRRALAASVLDDESVRLLGGFDTFLLAHATKTHLVEPRFHTRVYRPQAWISPVVLVGGRIAGVWFTKPSAGRVNVSVESFRRLPARIRQAIESEFSRLESFLGAACDVRFVARAAGR